MMSADYAIEVPNCERGRMARQNGSAFARGL